MSPNRVSDLSAVSLETYRLAFHQHRLSSWPPPTKMRRLPILFIFSVFFIFSFLSRGGPKVLASRIPVGDNIGIDQLIQVVLLCRVRSILSRSISRRYQNCRTIREPINHRKSIRDFYLPSRTSIYAKRRHNFNTDSPCVLHTRRYRSMDWIFQHFEFPLLHSLHQPLRRSSPSSLAGRNSSPTGLYIRNPQMPSHRLELYSKILSRM